MKWVWEVSYYWGRARGPEDRYERFNLWVEAASPSRCVALATTRLKQIRKREGFKVPAQIYKVKRMGYVDAR